MNKHYTVIFLLLLFCFVGCSPVASNLDTKGQEATGVPAESTPVATPGNPVEDKVAAGERTEVVLYFAGADGCLVPVKREVPKVPGIARKAIEELCLGPDSEGLLATIPQGTQLLDINIHDNLCTVDFSEELAKNHPGGSSGELLTVYSIVNTLTQFPTVEKVIIRIGGENVQTLAGHLDLSIPLERNSDILKS